MMKKESFKKLGILGVSFALMSSPLAFAQVNNDEEPKIGTTQETDIEGGNTSMDSSHSADGASQDPTMGHDVDDPKTGTRQQSALDEGQGKDISNEGAGEGEVGIPGTGAQNGLDTGTRGQPDLDEDDEEE
ncbi:hypothetical protein [Vreelandella sulfidaeris]|uniref:hypothetical protein n=1 Tax=Vreelandella sulfidaeris TaxID=115553 RepID=UPI0035E4D9C6